MPRARSKPHTWVLQDFLFLLFSIGCATPFPPSSAHNSTAIDLHKALPRNEVPLELMTSNEQVEAIIAKKVPVTNTALEEKTNAMEDQPGTPVAATGETAQSVVAKLVDTISNRSPPEDQHFNSRSMFSLFRGGLELAPDAVKALQEGLAARGLDLEEVKSTNDLPHHVPLIRGPASYFILKKGTPISYIRIADGSPFVLFVPLEEGPRKGAPLPAPAETSPKLATAKVTQPGPPQQHL